jgi:hypothetical protein
MKFHTYISQNVAWSLCCCSMGDNAGMLLRVISVLMYYFTWYLYRSNNVNILRCGHVESDRVYWNACRSILVCCVT